MFPSMSDLTDTHIPTTTSQNVKVGQGKEDGWLDHISSSVEDCGVDSCLLYICHFMSYIAFQVLFDGINYGLFSKWLVSYIIRNIEFQDGTTLIQTVQQAHLSMCSKLHDRSFFSLKG